ncbi:hypothetical protein ISN45_Aa06g038800 [Arabidopsis thaliana x Arabidopsis arenosa]|uniref:Uncharacterized protein n=1 Tax=Arabidopsis thaliana x Arabidopsis arenosa TaxID=1240361 RepID=A0A8T1Z676_9BRAS|nr:hypothetical protein ISN45_Aa06g038800 [Arabidopsis thaliana x Arabidopsis arenosa]
MKQREAEVVVQGLVFVRVGCSRGWLCGSSLRGSVPLIRVWPDFVVFAGYCVVMESRVHDSSSFGFPGSGWFGFGCSWLFPIPIKAV